MKTKLLMFSCLLAAGTLNAATLDYSTFIGGSYIDYGYSVSTDGSGNAYVSGETYSSSFPTTVGAYDTSHNGGVDIFVSKLNSDGSSLEFSTFIGGAGTDNGYTNSVDGSGNVFLSGYTGSSGFPTTTGVYDTSHNGGDDSFAVKLNSTGTALIFSTFLGGSSGDYGITIKSDDSGNVFLSGSTISAFPTTAGAYDTSQNGGYDGSVTKLNSTGTSLVYSTFLGGSSSDEAISVISDGSGNTYVSGNTNSTGFPTTVGCYDSSHNGIQDAFVTKLNSTGSALLYSTFFGASSTDKVYSVVIDGSGNAYFGGHTQSSGFPTTAGAYDTSQNGSFDGYVTKLNSSGSAPEYSTVLGGNSSDYANSITIDGNSNAFVAGETSSSDFPTTSGAYDTSQNGNADAFFSTLNSTGSTLSFSTFIGSASSDFARSVASDDSGNAYVTGHTQSSGFPTTSGVYDTSHNGNYDIFVLKFASSPTPPTFIIGDPTLVGTGSNNGSGGTTFTGNSGTLGSIATQGGTTGMSLVNINSNDYIAYYDVDCNGQVFLQVCFNINADWLTAFMGDPSTELRISHNGSFLPGNTITSLGNGNYQVCGTAPSCSPFFVQDQDDTPLAITLSHFSLSSNAKTIKLFWSTESETNNLGFKVYRAKENSTDFHLVASYTDTPELKGAGNSSVPLSYSFEDTEVEFGTTYTYFLSDVDIFGTETLHSDRKISGTLQKEDNSEEVGNFVYELKQNFPNPFNPNTSISYTLAKANDVKLEIYNTKGELVRTLVSENQTAGSHTSVWNGKDESGNLVSSGVYFYKLTAGNYTKTNKMILLK